MKNLQNFNGQQLTEKELIEINGGSWKDAFRAAMLVYEMMKETLKDPEKYYGNNADNPLSGAKL